MNVRFIASVLKRFVTNSELKKGKLIFNMFFINYFKTICTCKFVFWEALFVSIQKNFHRIFKNFAFLLFCLQLYEKTDCSTRIMFKVRYNFIVLMARLLRLAAATYSL